VPEPLTGIRLTYRTGTSLAFEWNSTRGAASYRVTLNSSQHAEFRDVEYLTVVPKAAFTGLLPGTEYVVKVQASNAKGRNSTASTFNAYTGKPILLFLS